MINFFLKKDIAVYKLDDDLNQTTNRYTQSSLMHGFGLLLEHIYPARVLFYILVKKTVGENAVKVTIPSASDLLTSYTVKEMIEKEGFSREEVDLKVRLVDYLFADRERGVDKDYYSLVGVSSTLKAAIDDSRQYQINVREDEKVIELDWRLVLDLWNSLLEKNIVSGLERVIIRDYLTMAKDELFSAANEKDKTFTTNKELFEKINEVFNEWDPLKMTSMTEYEYEDYAWELVKEVYLSNLFTSRQVGGYLNSIGLFQSYFDRDEELLKDMTEKVFAIVHQFQRDIFKTQKIKGR